MKHYPRRDFLGKLSVLMSAFFAFIHKGNAKTINSNSMKNETIKKIKPLGFQWETTDPFLFCVHHEDFFPKGNDNMGPEKRELEGRDIGQDFIVKNGWRMYHGNTIPGFPRHPHRGFETVTVVRKGMVDHTDSLGGAGRYGGGDVQWMTAGKGVQHAEMFPLLNKDEENTMELFQIWLNLPKSKKFAEPSYKMLWREDIPTYTHKDVNGNKTSINIIAGNIENHTAPAPNIDSWANDKNNAVAIWTINMEKHAKFTFPSVQAGSNRTLYFFKGKDLTIESKAIPPYHAVEIGNTDEFEVENGNSESSLLLLQGKPIDEPVVQHGPFVMNTKEEIRDAFNDYQQTQFGGWPMAKIDPVHPRDKGRFALHSNGSEIVK